MSRGADLIETILPRGRRPLPEHDVIFTTTLNPTHTMSIFEPSPSPWTGRMLSVLRIVAGLIFLSSGTMKLFGYPPSPIPMPPIPVMSQIWIGAVIETIGGACIVLGLFTRPVAFVLAGEMAVAYFQFHFPQAFFPNTNQGIPAVLFCFIYLYLTFAGGGAWSVDAALVRSRRLALRAAPST